MNLRLSLAASLLFLPLPLVSCCSTCESGPNVRANRVADPITTLDESFDGEVGTLPEGWTPGTTNPRPGSKHALWQLQEDGAAPSPPGTLALVDALGHLGQTFNLCWIPLLEVQDVDLSTGVRAVGGREDQGGGPAWRIGSAGDYYVARWNPLEDNFRVYSVVGGERLQLASARVRVDPEAWHRIRVRHVGDSITCWFDGKELLHAKDAKLTGGGAVGLWTKADATTSFDDFAVAPAE